MRGAAETLKRITLELGGKSPNIVFADADLDAAVRGATIGHLLRQGRGLRRRLAAAGGPVDQGRVHRQARGAREEDGARRSDRSEDAPRRDRRRRSSSNACCATSRSAKNEGATLVAGGARADIGTGKGYFVQPTVFADVTPGDDDRARGDLRPRARGDRVRRRRRGDRARERLDLRPRRRRLDARHQEGALRRPQAPGRHRLDQHLQRVRHGRARSAATSRAASAARWACTRSSTTRRSRACGWI